MVENPPLHYGPPGQMLATRTARSVSCSHGGPTMRVRLRLLLLAAAVLAAPLMSHQAASARAAAPPFHELWRADSRSGFADWSLQGARIVDGRIALDPATASLPQQVEGLSLP